ncbi:UNVERIFIED_CONTAM: hypothetical protein Sangu_1491600 [Sesamum angustifolium]|uniref:Uncharacterized protein n=1 Tax=Sesamum angustifolium TaxID=2727405 RepID=A0AAW2MRJ1_9LAMI
MESTSTSSFSLGSVIHWLFILVVNSVEFSAGCDFLYSSSFESYLVSGTIGSSSLFPADSTVGSRLLSKLVATGQPAMGHRHMFNTPLIHETDADEGWNHAEQPYMPMARSGVSGSSSLVHPVENTTIQGGPSTSLWNPPPRSSGYSSSTLNVQLPHYQPQVPTPSHDPFPHQPPGGNFYMVPDAYSHHPSSTSLSGQTVPGVDFYNQTMGSGRGPYKRKSPGSMPYDRGTPSRYYDVGSSSNQYLPADGLQEKRSTESHHIPWEYPPGYRVNSLSIGGEGMLRNVRSRTGIHMEPNLARTRLPSNYLYCSFSSRSSDLSNLVDFRGQGSNPPRREWDSSLVAGHVVNCDTESGGYSNNAISNGNPAPQNANNHQSVRGVRSGYCQTSVPSFGSSSSNFHSGQVGASDEGLQMSAESYLSRHPRVFSTTRLRNGERIGRAGILRDRYRSFTEEASLRDRLTSEGLMVGDHPTFYESRTLFDLHREMRLDVDNMSYEGKYKNMDDVGSEMWP